MDDLEYGTMNSIRAKSKIRCQNPN